MQKKIIDSTPEISIGGRADSYWANKGIKRSNKYNDGKKSTSTNIDPAEVIKEYNLKGFEFGNWVNNNDRYDFLLATIKSLLDLSKIFTSKNIGLDNSIGIAFGARGNWGALAHFEPDTYMINLTKMKGFHSLAHEYGHAIDYFFGEYVDQNKKIVSLSGGSSTARTLKDNDGGELRALMNNILNTIIYDREGNLTASYKRLLELKEGNEYWFRRNEIFARAFEQYIKQKLTTLKLKNTFLAKDKYKGSVYLYPADFKKVYPLIDKLVKIMSAFANNKKKTVSIIPTIKKAAATKNKSSKTVKKTTTEKKVINATALKKTIKKNSYKPKVKNKNVSISSQSAIKEVIKLNKYSDLKPMEATMLYSAYKTKNYKANEGTLKFSIFEKLAGKNYVSDLYDEVFPPTPLGADFIKAVRARIESLKGQKYGYNIF